MTVYKRKRRVEIILISFVHSSKEIIWSFFSSSCTSFLSFFLSFLFFTHQICIPNKPMYQLGKYVAMLFVMPYLCFRASRDNPLLPSFSAADLLLSCSWAFFIVLTRARSRWFPPWHSNSDYNKAGNNLEASRTHDPLPFTSLCIRKPYITKTLAYESFLKDVIKRRLRRMKLN